MRKILITTLFAAVAMPAMATDSGDAAFELLSKYSVEIQKTNYIKLQSNIDMVDVMEIDAKISEIYGAPKNRRAGLKVWEVENNSDRGGKHTTIICGQDGKGGAYISADRRGKAQTQTPKRQEKNSIKQTKPSKPSYLKTKTTFQERD